MKSAVPHVVLSSAVPHVVLSSAVPHVVLSSAVPRYAFHFDARACAGCKACQIACKDKHGLEVGRLWRRVYDVTGGDWRREGDAWISDVFAFHLSVGCNHCVRPICVEVCPSLALRQREDGIVTLDTDRCLGCSYCEWACPYGAPQYDAARGCMTKCTFCADELDEEREPACVTACPLRVLELGVGAENEPLAETLEMQAPLPDPRLTAPALWMREHRDGTRAREEAVEVVPRRRHELHEWSLVVFTMLTSLAAGAAMWAGITNLFGPRPTPIDLGRERFDPLWVVIATAMAVALLTSLRHLGSPRRAYLAVSNFRTSWLSREILAALAFTFVGAGLLLVTASPESSKIIAGILHAVAFFGGLTLVWIISRVYGLRTVPTWFTSLRFPTFLTVSLLLGSFVLVTTRHLQGMEGSAAWWLIGATIVLLLVRRSLLMVEAARQAARAGREPELGGLAVAVLAHGGEPAAVAFLNAVWEFLSVALLALAVPGLGRPEEGHLGTIALLLAFLGVLGIECYRRHRFFQSYDRCGV